MSEAESRHGQHRDDPQRELDESCLLIVVGGVVCGYDCGMQTTQVVNTRRMCLCWPGIRELTHFLPIIDELVDDRAFKQGTPIS